jgi:hypothetical protein
MTFNCYICKKTYSSYQSLWNHNHKFHNDSDLIDSKSQESTENNSDNDDISKCKFCNKKFSNRQSRWRHEKTCPENDIKNTLEHIKNEIEILKKNSQEIATNKNNNSKNTNIINNGTIINGQNNNVSHLNLVQPGFENINDFTFDEVKNIFNSEISDIIKLIDTINFSKNRPRFNSYQTTSIESAYLSVYNAETKTIDKDRKKYFFEDIICKTIQKHELLYNKYKNKFDSDKRQKLEENIMHLKKIKDDSFSSKIMQEMIRNLNMLSYNKRDIVQKTWDGTHDEESDDEDFMKMLLDDPETQKIIAENKKKELEKNNLLVLSQNETNNNTSDKYNKSKKSNKSSESESSDIILSDSDCDSDCDRSEWFNKIMRKKKIDKSKELIL